MIQLNSNYSLTSLVIGSFLLFSSFFFSSCETSPFPDGVPPCERPVELSGYTMVWNDEFDGDQVDTTKWSFQIGDGCDIVPDSCGAFEEVAPNLCGWGNNEKQWYTNFEQNAKVENGILSITAIEEPQPFNGYDYTSARLRSLGKGDWKYARIDIRAKMPIGQGFWPAIWMLSSEQKYGGWPCSGEIDIMEYLGNKPQEVFSTIHFGNERWRFISQYRDTDTTNFANGFHDYTLIWDEQCMRFMVDGEFIGNPVSPSSTVPQGYPFQEKFHLILNLAVGGNLPGDPTPSTPFPQSLDIDYVRVYQRN